MTQRASKYLIPFVLLSLMMIMIVIFLGSQTIAYRAALANIAEVKKGEVILEEVEAIITDEIAAIEASVLTFSKAEHDFSTDIIGFFQIENNRLVSPNPKALLTHKEMDLVALLKPIVENPEKLYQAYQNEAGLMVTQGWFVSYNQDIPILIYWLTTEAGIMGYQVSYIALLTKILNKLADLENTHSVIVIEENGQLLFQQQENLITNILYAERPLSFPLNYWQLKYYDKPYNPIGIYLLGSCFVLLFVLFIIWFFYRVYREYQATKQVAAQQVSFVSQVSHELKTPLTNISLFSELLKEANVSAEINHYSGIIHSESLRLSRLIQNVLNFTKTRKTHFEMIDLVDTLQGLKGVFEPAFKAKNLQLNVLLPEKCDLYTDQDALVQIISNFLSNAEKYGSHGKQVDLSLERVKDQVIIEVRDYGEGISDKHMKKIFTPFFRVHSKITEGVAGTGIGLTISARLAASINGKITVHPQVQGVTFRLTI